jgi:hypothetical protein
MTVLFSTEPYGRYLRSHYTDEVTERNGRYFVSLVRYRNDVGVPIELERTDHHEKDGFGDLHSAIAAAQAGRRSYLQCEADEMAGAVEELREQEISYQRKSVAANEAALDPFQGTSSCNTRIDYLYRDAGNYKVYDSIIVAGVLTEQEQKDLHDALDSDCFIPEQVGMRALQSELKAEAPGCDGAWHEISEISITEDPTTFPGTAHELLAKFKQTVWDPSSSQVDESMPAMGGL